MDVNRELARIFLEMALYTEYLGEGRYKAQAYRRAHDIFLNLAMDAREIYEREGKEGFLAIEGIGKAIADKTVEFLETGRISKHQELAAKVPPGIRKLLMLKGIGPKTLRLMVEHLGVGGADDILRAAKTGELTRVPGIGPKRAEAIARAILEARERGQC